MKMLRRIVACAAVAACCRAQDLQEAQSLYRKGVSAFQAGAFVDAVISLRSAQKLGLNSTALHNALGIAYYSIHQYTLFLDQMDEANKADPGDASPYHYLGRYYEFDLHNYPLALSYFEKALVRSPRDAKSLHFRAVCLQMMGKNEEAKQGYEAAIRVIEGNLERFSWAHRNLAELLLDAESPDALRYAEKAVKIDPTEAGNYLTLGKAQEAGGRLPEALLAYREASRLKPDDAATRYLLFRLYKKMGNTEAAAAELRLHDKLRRIYGSKK